ncbi:MAG: winged helix-turn-helix domain-containing protein [Nitrososphaerales archaeon]
MVKNRSRTEIIYDIVAHADPSARKTHLMYGANLSFGMLDLYLDHVMAVGLLEEIKEEGGRVFSTTEKGKRFIAVFEEMKSLFDPVKIRETRDMGERSSEIASVSSLG